MKQTSSGEFRGGSEMTMTSVESGAGISSTKAGGEAMTSVKPGGLFPLRVVGGVKPPCDTA